MLKLIRSWLRAGVLKDGQVIDPTSGTAQGSPISPLLCNIVLHVLDEEWERNCRGLGRLVRYADDWVALCASRHRAEEARRRMATVLRPLGLELNPDKTRIICLTRGKEGLDFLGYHLHKVQSWKWKGRWYLQRWPSARVMKSVRAKIRALTDRRLVGFTIASVVDGINRVLRGWAAYFRFGNSAAKFSMIDRYVHERLAVFTSIKHGLPGRKRHWGSVRSPVVRRSRRVPPRWKGSLRACACLTVNDVGKPCEVAPHARFERGPLAKRSQQ
jgi:group II intron reverse transcriptase/maturase